MVDDQGTAGVVIQDERLDVARVQLVPLVLGLDHEGGGTYGLDVGEARTVRLPEAASCRLAHGSLVVG